MYKYNTYNYYKLKNKLSLFKYPGIISLFHHYNRIKQKHFEVASSLNVQHYCSTKHLSNSTPQFSQFMPTINFALLEGKASLP